MKKEYKVYYSGKDFKGEGFYNYDYQTLKILKGSKIVRNESHSFRKLYPLPAKIKDELIDEGIIDDYQFTKDHRFDKAFHASSILSSDGTPGNKAWRTREGKDINEIIDSRKNIDRFKEYYENFEFKKDPKRIQETIDQFNQNFPLEDLPHLKIEEYDKLGSKETLAYAIEHGTDSIFKGFLATKRNKIIFNVKEDEYDCVDSLKNKYPQKNTEEIYKLYINSLYKLIIDFDKATYSKGEIDALPENTNIIRLKLLTLYRPEELLHIGSVKWFRGIFNYFGLSHSDMDSVMMNI